jgi:type IV pilus assembly protein PilW
VFCNGVLSMKISQFPAQRGFSLVELMISITIGLAMIVFVSSLYLRSKTSYDITDDNSRMQQEARLVMASLGRNLTQSGFGEPITFSGPKLVSSFHRPLLLPEADRPQALRVCDGGFTSPASLTDKSCRGGAGAPGFEVSYVVPRVPNINTGAGVDCNGQAVPADTDGEHRVINRYYLSDADSAGVRSLICLGNGGPGPQPLLSNVEDMRITLGLDTSGERRPGAFFTSAQAARDVEGLTVPPFSRVVSVGLCLQLTSANRVDSKSEQRYVDCSGTSVAPTDRRIHMAVTGVYTLRNHSGTSLLPY